MYITFTPTLEDFAIIKMFTHLKVHYPRKKLKYYQIVEWLAREKVEYKNQELRILFFPILGLQGAYKDQNIRE
jgi:hypothetical protein